MDYLLLSSLRVSHLLSLGSHVALWTFSSWSTLEGGERNCALVTIPNPMNGLGGEKEFNVQLVRDLPVDLWHLSDPWVPEIHCDKEQTDQSARRIYINFV